MLSAGVGRGWRHVSSTWAGAHVSGVMSSEHAWPTIAISGLRRSTTPSAPAPTPRAKVCTGGTARTSDRPRSTPTCRNTDTPGTLRSPCRSSASWAGVNGPEVRRGLGSRGPPRVALVLDPHEAEPLGGAGVDARAEHGIGRPPRGRALGRGGLRRGRRARRRRGRDRGRRRRDARSSAPAPNSPCAARPRAAQAARRGVRHSRFRPGTDAAGGEGERPPSGCAV